VQPVATCRQSPYLRKPATVILIVTSRAYGTRGARSPRSTSFSLWRHSLLSWPRPPLWTYERTYVRTYVRTPYRV